MTTRILPDANTGFAVNVSAVQAVGTQNATLTAAQVLIGLIEHTVITGAGTLTLPTATLLNAATPNLVVGDTITVLVCNTAASALSSTVAVGAGITLKNTAAVTAVSQGRTATWQLRLTAANAFDLYVTVSA